MGRHPAFDSTFFLVSRDFASCPSNFSFCSPADADSLGTFEIWNRRQLCFYRSESWAGIFDCFVDYLLSSPINSDSGVGIARNSMIVLAGASWSLLWAACSAFSNSVRFWSADPEFWSALNLRTANQSYPSAVSSQATWSWAEAPSPEKLKPLGLSGFIAIAQSWFAQACCVYLVLLFVFSQELPDYRCIHRYVS